MRNQIDTDRNRNNPCQSSSSSVIHSVRIARLRGKHFTASMVSWIRFKHRIPGPARPSGTLSVAEVGQRYGVSHWVVYEWIGKGLLPAHRRKPGMPYAITITGATDHALRDFLPTPLTSPHLP